MTSSLVGSEMCIRDRSMKYSLVWHTPDTQGGCGLALLLPHDNLAGLKACLLYTSDAADDM
eukprot:2530286-Prorocentrum_lima.AAC.1